MLRLKNRHKPRLATIGQQRAARESAEREIVAALAQLLLEDVSRPKGKQRLRLVHR
jgi:hypothetical protein